MVGNSLLSTAITLTETPVDAFEMWKRYPLIVPLSEYLTFLCGIIMLIFTATKFGKHIENILPTALVLAFTSAASLAIVTSQIKHLFGLKLPPITGTFVSPRTWFAFVENIATINYVTTLVGVCVFVVINLLGYVEPYLDLWYYYKKWAGYENLEGAKAINLPKALLSIIITSLMSFLLDFENSFGVAVVGKVVSGPPTFSLPWRILESTPKSQHFRIMIGMIPDAVSISLIAYVTMKAILQSFPPHKQETGPSESSALISPQSNALPTPVSGLTTAMISPVSLNKDEDTEINEQIALTVSNLVSPFFSGYVPAGSLSRSAILATQTESQTPLANFFASFLSLITIMFLTDFVYYIPLSVLAAITIVSLQSTLFKISKGYEIFKKWRMEQSIRNFKELSIWFITFVTVIGFDPSVGVVCGMVTCVIWILYYKYYVK
ncbi:hypothetical protein HK103_002740 [Boothiomyces macroporosus]|uniref:SLC26A/SulP transporter domain-containing protein n=1 Tax=Boothiomyces macroporosus TaxID=261099 RepID=A0AAD5UPL8_9FUNG|nr:hypothetical protein HK103_002740 [Boothiomyces macroporosus]